MRPASAKENRRDRRWWSDKSPKRRVVVIMRERGGRTLPIMVRHERHAGPTLEARIALGSIVYANEVRS